MKVYVVICTYYEVDSIVTDIVAAYHSRESAEAYVAKKNKQVETEKERLVECTCCLLPAMQYLDNVICGNHALNLNRLRSNLPETCPLNLKDAPNIKVWRNSSQGPCSIADISEQPFDIDDEDIYDITCENAERMRGDVRDNPYYSFKEIDLW